MRVTLKNMGSSAVIDSKGAELKSLIQNGKEIMWSGDLKYWGKSSPFLFPMIGNLRGGKTKIYGEEYEISKHGFARDNEFTVLEQADDRAVFGFSSNDETKKSFPFDFSVTLEYSLKAEKLEITYRVTNKSERVMPYCIGAHPAFALDADISNYKLIFAEKETVNSPVMNLETRMWGDNNRISRLAENDVFPLRYDLFDNDCVYFDTLRSKNVSLLDNSKNGVKVSWEGFETLGVWTPDHKKAPFVCIEPWCGCDDYDTDSGIFTEKRGIQTAEAGETKMYKMIIEKISAEG